MEMVQKEVKAVRRQRYAQAQGCTWYQRSC
jgi:hypothetical protein